MIDRCNKHSFDVSDEIEDLPPNFGIMDGVYDYSSGIGDHLSSEQTPPWTRDTFGREEFFKGSGEREGNCRHFQNSVDFQPRIRRFGTP